MILHDLPIKSSRDDELERKNFSEKLGSSILSWDGLESLAIGLYGKWGSGKTSVINMVIEYISNSQSKNKPTNILFNPWIFSHDGEALHKHFFIEIANSLKIKSEAKKDRKIAKLLKLYSELLDSKNINYFGQKLLKRFLKIVGFLGILFGFSTYLLNLTLGNMRIFIIISGCIILGINVISIFFEKISKIFEIKALKYDYSAQEIKKQIRDDLKKRKKYLLIIIDDIDRLNLNEILKVFSLVRANADFPHTIYLLAFERKTIAESLEKTINVEGKDYIEKIIQVNFDLPEISRTLLMNYFFKELNNLISSFPPLVHKFFNNQNTYWPNIYHSGFKNLFSTIRDIKRYLNSLYFNLKILCSQFSVEVNPIDFMAIEAIRIFAPEFYQFLKLNQDLFTLVDRDQSDSKNGDTRKKLLEDEINKLNKSLKTPILELVKKLFPQIENIYDYGYSTFGDELYSVWRKDLRVCSPDFFKTYFALTPSGSPKEVNQYELSVFFGTMNGLQDIESLIINFIQKGKFRSLLERIQDYTSDIEKIDKKSSKNIIQALFNISDEIPEEQKNIFDIGTIIDVMRVIRQLLIRNSDKNENYLILKESINNSKGLLGPIKRVDLEDQHAEVEENRLIIPKDKLDDLKKICVIKIKEFSRNESFMKSKNVPYYLIKWERWGDESEAKEYIKHALQDNFKMVDFLKKFKYQQTSLTHGDMVEKYKPKFNFEGLNHFLDIKSIKQKLIDMKSKNAETYKHNSEIIDFYLQHFEYYLKDAQEYLHGDID